MTSSSSSFVDRLPDELLEYILELTLKVSDDESEEGEEASAGEGLDGSQESEISDRRCNDDENEDCRRAAFIRPPHQRSSSTRPGLLQVCKRFHALGRRALYEEVGLSTFKGFHTFFLVDQQDFVEQRSGRDVSTRWERLYGIPRWRDRLGSVERREEDWKCVRKLSVDVNFSNVWSDIGADYEHPYLINSLGRVVTLLQLPATRGLLPNLVELVELNSAPAEDYEVYRVQTMFRYAFYGDFSPLRFKLPVLPTPAHRYVHAPAQRFPNSLLSRCEHIHVRDLDDLDDLFPLLRFLPRKIRAAMLNDNYPQQSSASTTSDDHHHQIYSSGVHAHPHTSTPLQPLAVEAVSYSIRTITCISENFGYYMAPDLFEDYFRNRLSFVVQQFPNVSVVHLPRIDAFHLTKMGRSQYFMWSYSTAIELLKQHDVEAVRRLKVQLDQDAGDHDFAASVGGVEFVDEAMFWET